MKTHNKFSQMREEQGHTDPVNGTARHRISIGSIASRYSLASLICALMLTLGVGNVWGADITFSASTDKGDVSANGTCSGDDVTKSGITISSSNGPMGNGSDYRVYSSGTLTISGTDITKVVVTCTATGDKNYGPKKLSGTGYSGGTSYTGTWSGSATTSVTLSANAQVRMTKIVVTAGSSAKTFTLKVPDGTGGYTTYNNKEKSYLTQTTAEGGNSCGGGLDGTYSGWRLYALETPNASPGTTYNSSTADGTLPSSGSTLYAVFRQTSGSYYFHTNPLCAAVKTLSSIAITTQPTMTKYLVGETFSSSGAVVTATYTDETTADVSSSTTWTPTTGLVSGSNTITATYTEGGVTKTATTTVTAYAVTVQKQDTEGNTISAAGVTATASGRSLTASVGSTKYVFKTWKFGTNSGTSISNATSATTGSLTGTPSAAVTVIAEFYKPFTVTWSVNGSTSTISATTNVAYNTTVTMPTPSVPQDCNGSTFMGWTTSTNANYSSDSAPSPLYNGTSPAITGDVTYYAVFAEED